MAPAERAGVSAGAWITIAVALQVVGVTGLRASDGLRRPGWALVAFGGLVGF